MPDETYLLASDLDGTLIPPDGVVGDGGVGDLARLLEARPGTLAYVTGRHLSLALEGIERHALPAPDIVVCDVGTSVFLRGAGGFEPDPEYRDRMSTAFGGAAPEALRDTLAALDDLRPQEPEKQGEFKLSYYSEPGEAGAATAHRAAELLRASGASVNVVYSVDSVADTGLIDVLPEGVAKDTAVRYLHARSGVSHERLVYAGDSGNDRAAMLSGVQAIVVGNAAAEFKRAIRMEAVDAGLSDRLYVAEESYAQGVLEGCRHFGIL